MNVPLEKDLYPLIPNHKKLCYFRRTIEVYTIAYEFETEEEMRLVADQLWNKHGITGEFEMYQSPNGKFRLQIYSEKQIRDGVLEKIPGKAVQVKGNYGVPAPKEVLSEDN